VVVFAPDVAARLAAGEELVIGSSSPRRASFVPDFLRWALPRAPGGGPRVRLVELRGNVDSRLRRLREPRGSARQLDGVVLAFAGLARLWADASAHEMALTLLAGLPRMVLPLSVSPAAPAQGALAIECRPEDTTTARLLAALDDPATRRAAEVERALLAERGGGCHQRFGATQIEVPRLGSVLYVREAHERSGAVELEDTLLHWTPASPLPTLPTPVRAWDGSRARDVEAEPLAAGVTVARRAVSDARAVFVAHRRAWPQSENNEIKVGTALWVPGVETWRALAKRGVWVEGCADGLGWAQIEGLLAEPWLTLPPPQQWTILTHAQAAREWECGQVIATYQSRDAGEGPPADATHIYWASGAQFDRWRATVGGQVVHACGPGKTSEHLRRAGVTQVRTFPSVQQWRDWLAS
jgi:hydroxymethylbilane synthase